MLMEDEHAGLYIYLYLLTTFQERHLESFTSHHLIHAFVTAAKAAVHRELTGTLGIPNALEEQVRAARCAHLL
jgi:hypothetical protein